MVHAGPAAFLTDFGLAKNVSTGSRYTRTGETLGTPAYMSPEQARGEHAHLTAASDAWALGAVLYELLAGAPAFRGDTAAAVIGQVVAGRPASLQALRPDLPPGVVQFVHACLTRDPAVRPAGGAAVHADLERLLAGDRPLHRPRRRKTPFVVAAAVVLLGTAGWLAVALRPEPEPVVTAPRESKAERLATQGWDLRGRDVVEAAELLGRAVALDPGRHDWRLQHGLLLWACGRNEPARQAWAAIDGAAPQRPEADLYIALELTCRLYEENGTVTPGMLPLPAARAPGETGDLGKALQAVLSNDPAGAVKHVAHSRRWEAALIRGIGLRDRDPRGALEAYDQALAQGLTFVFALNGRGIAKLTLGDPRGAIEDFEAALALAPENTRALTNRGMAKAAAGDRAGALADYDAALDLDPRFGWAMVNRGVLKADAGDLRGALAEYDAAIAAMPRLVLAYVNRSALRGWLGDLRGALDDCNAALALEPRNHEALGNRAQCKQASGDLPGALADLDAAIAARPADRKNRRARGALHAQLRDFAAAIADYTHVLEREPRDVPALVGRGLARSSSGDMAGALADFDAALEIDPADYSALANRALIHFRTGRFTECESDCSGALRAAPPGWQFRRSVESLRARARAALGR